jgi:hypothetical protein
MEEIDKRLLREGIKDFCIGTLLVFVILMCLWMMVASTVWWMKHPDAEAADYPPVKAMFFED